jgi:peptidoglycan/LPS O-acetylase OafA/YrhL
MVCGLAILMVVIQHARTRYRNFVAVAFSGTEGLAQHFFVLSGYLIIR